MRELMSPSLSKLGFVSPCTQSETVGCDTASHSANCACLTLVTSNQSRSRFIGSNIDDFDISAIGQTHADSCQTVFVGRPTTRTVWARVKEALIEAKLPATQVYVAKQLKMSQPSISEWNLEGGYPTIENAISLAKMLNVTVEWLLTERGPKRPLPQDATAQRLWDMWSQLDEVTKGELIGIASGRLRRSDKDEAGNYRSA